MSAFPKRTNPRRNASNSLPCLWLNRASCRVRSAAAAQSASSAACGTARAGGACSTSRTGENCSGSSPLGAGLSVAFMAASANFCGEPRQCSKKLSKTRNWRSGAKAARRSLPIARRGGEARAGARAVFRPMGLDRGAILFSSLASIQALLVQAFLAWKAFRWISSNSRFSRIIGGFFMRAVFGPGRGNAE